MKRYLEIAGELRARMDSGRLRPHQKLASQNELATEFGVCQATVQKSLKELERAGLLWTHPGKGRFVADREVRSRTWTLGVILFDMEHLTHPVTSQRLSGITDVTAEAGYHLNILAMNGQMAPSRQPANGTGLFGSFDPATIDGAIVLAQETDAGTVHKLADLMPTVWMDAPNAAGIASVNLDYLGGGFAAAQHLIGLGHERIALLTPRLERFWVARQQYDGARLAVGQSRGGRVLLELHVAETFAESEGYRLGAEILATDGGPTAVICASDELALGFWVAAVEAGRSVPKDLSLVAWNDTITPAQIPVSLTTIRMDFRGAGMTGARTLLAMIDEPGSRPSPEPFGGQLVVRASTAAPRRSRSPIS